MHKRVLAVAVMFLMSLVLTNGGTGVSSAAGKTDTSKTQAVQSEEPKKLFDAHEAYVRYHFKDSDMDFTFGSLVLGATVNHGCEIGEAFRTAAHIKDGDAAGNRCLVILSQQHRQTDLLALGRAYGPACRSRRGQ